MNHQQPIRRLLIQARQRLHTLQLALQRDDVEALMENSTKLADLADTITGQLLMIDATEREVLP